MKKATSAIILFLVLFVLIVSANIVNFVAANPMVPPPIRVDSPHNNQIYSSGDVWLNYTWLPFSGTEITSVTYRLDNQAEITANESTLLSGLSAGSHSLAIYGKFSAERDDYGYMITKIYFSVDYSTAWLTFAVVSSTVLAVGLVAFFVTRRRLAALLKGKKTATFWAGIVFLFTGSLFLGLIIRGAAADYLFPTYHSGLVVNLYPSLILSLLLMGIGMTSMWRGIKKEKAPKVLK